MDSLGSSPGEISPEPLEIGEISSDPLEVGALSELDERGWGGAESVNMSSSSSEYSRSRWSSVVSLEGGGDGCEGVTSVRVCGEWVGGCVRHEGLVLV